ncbi:unnamed protein product [Linum trigynum]|uniref:Uncharacterized protein n=1 Tax=Linum trigynum TaxID=586398 RepID=A0AAV2EC26_9ROSI
MAAPNQHGASLRLAQAAIFNGKGFEDAAGYARYLLQFQDRPLHPSITLDLSRFNSAKENRVISYPHLMFDHMLNYHADNYDAELPFAPHITQILLALGIDLRFKVARVDMISSLRAQFILRKAGGSKHISRNLMMEVEDAISDYVPSPKFSF